jgi:hypothetical protein
MIIMASLEDVPLGIRGGQTLIVDGGAVIPDHFIAGMESTVHVRDGGTVGQGLTLVDAKLEVSGGSVGGNISFFGNSRTNISGGSVGATIGAWPGSQVSISGGSVAGNFDVFPGSQLRISGGQVGSDAFYVRGEAIISGASVNHMELDGANGATRVRAALPRVGGGARRRRRVGARLSHRYERL